MTCPTCGKESVKDYKPFCSRRCADVDLGRWLTGSYALPGPPLDEEDLPPAPPANDRDEF
ncbi:MAG: DNA gyrase inhibitor YacG [Gemmobacter sp.]